MVFSCEKAVSLQNQLDNQLTDDQKLSILKM